MPLRLAILLCLAGLLATVLIARTQAPVDMAAETDMDAAALAGTWQLAELDGTALEAGPLLILGDDGQVNGDTGCNGFAGDYETEEGRLAFGPLAMTRRACVDPDANTREAVYSRALEATAGYTHTDGRLTLRGADGTALARFDAVPESAPVTFACDDGSQLVAVFLESDPPYVRLTRGEGGAMAARVISAGGARYEGDGVEFRNKGDEATVNWRGVALTCAER